MISNTNNQSKLKTKRIRIADETDSDDSLDSSDYRIKKKKATTQVDPNFNPNRPNQFAKKSSSSSKSSIRPTPEVVTEFANDNDENSDDESVSINYRQALNDYNRKVNGIVKPELINSPAATTTSAAKLFNNGSNLNGRHSLDSNLVQEVTENEERTLNLSTEHVGKCK